MRIVYTPALLTFLSLVLASSIGVAGAANSDVSKTKANPMQLAKDSLTLTRSQEKMAWNDIRKQASEQMAPLRFAASVGVEVPKNVTLRRIPETDSRIEVIRLRADSRLAPDRQPIRQKNR